jgi:hypothetical protein
MDSVTIQLWQPARHGWPGINLDWIGQFPTQAVDGDGEALGRFTVTQEGDSFITQLLRFGHSSDELFPHPIAEGGTDEPSEILHD